MNCPICHAKMSITWEHRDKLNTQFVGVYGCFHHGIIRMSGRVSPVRGDIIHTWHPACKHHGTEHVVVSDPEASRFYCIKCGRRMEVENGNLVTTWQPPATSRHPQERVSA